MLTDIFLRESEANIKEVKQLHDLKKYTTHLETVVKEQDAKMKASERMAAIGETAAMVGHDIRNPLQAITSDLYLLGEGLKEIPEGENRLGMKESLDSIQENIRYIDKIVADLQDFAKPKSPDWKRIKISDFLTEFLKSIVVPERIRIDVDIENPIEITVDPLFLRRALTNLVNNAIQAMPESGSLHITADKKNSTLRLRVCDSGDGIPDEVKARIFTPLVTTKSKGQGLGLAVAKRLIEALNGRISFQSEKGVGTEFLIELPSHKNQNYPVE